VRKGSRLIFLNSRLQIRGLVLSCEAHLTGEVFTKAQRRFLLSLITLRVPGLQKNTLAVTSEIT
jgi:hypothetical protein